MHSLRCSSAPCISAADPPNLSARPLSTPPGLIAVCGEALVDVVGGVRRPGGGPFNTARVLGRLGVPVAFVGHLSYDADGRELARALRSDGVSLDLVSTGPEPTTEAVARVGAGGVAEYEFAVQGTSAPQLESPVRLPPEVEAICVGSLGLVLEPMAAAIVELVERERGRRPIVADPNVRPGLIPDAEYRLRLMRIARSSTVVKASDADLAWLFEGLGHEAAAERLLGEGVRLVVVTLGAAGAFGAHRALRVAVPAAPVARVVVDTIGAGDAFGGALLAWMHHRHLLTVEIELSATQLRDALSYACGVTATMLVDAV
jgi:fructokinase